MRKKWLIAIKSGKKPSKYTKICSKHFTQDSYVVTSMGRYIISYSISSLLILLLGQWKILKKAAIPTLHLPVRKHDSIINTNRRPAKYTKRNDLKEKISMSSNTDHLGQNVNLVSNNPNTENNSYTLNYESTSTSYNLSSDMGTQTVISFKRAQLISYEFLTESQLKHLTGLSKNLFNFFCEHFGTTYCKIHPALSTENELIITFMKYKLNLYYATLANLFDIDSRTVSKIVVSWSKHLYKCFHKIDFWNLATASPEQYNIILDCTEFRIERSSDPIIQQATYSTYYGTNTFKVLIGCSENGEITFVSDVYGGSISDRKITEVSGLLHLMQDEQFVLADRGFDISDVLEEKGVHLNIPPFKHGKQLSEEDVMKTRLIANRRIIVENLIGVAKKHKILTDRISVSMWPIINEIVYNCFMVCNFKENIVKK